MADQDIVRVHADDGTAVPLYWHPSPTPRWQLLLLPALGIQARLYRGLAQSLANRSVSVAIMEQRGHGESPLRAGYRCRYGLDDILDRDMPAALGWLAEQAPGCPLALGGHSLGGHLSTLYAGQHPDAVQAILHLACGFPYIDSFPPAQQRQLRLLSRLIPLFALAPGYYPGERLGFGGRESIVLMRQWRDWALTGRFDFRGRTGMAEAVADYRGPVHSIQFAEDAFAPDAAVLHALSPFRNARISRVAISREVLGEQLGHTRWARVPEPVAAGISAWLEGLEREHQR